MRSALTLAIAVIMSLQASAQELVTEEAAIDHNPFQRPPGLRAPSAADGAAPTLMAVDSLELRAVLHAGANSQANINGRIMGLGEEVDGYRLVSVSLEGVELRREGETVVLTLDRPGSGP